MIVNTRGNMKYVVKFLSFMGMFILLTVTSCLKDKNDLDGPDVEKPLIKMLSTNPRAGEGVICGLKETHVIHAITDQDIFLNLEFSDNANLAQYKIDIHNNFDCHSHRSSPWEVLKIENIEGEVLKITETLTIPQESWSGNYHLQIQCIDESGNEADPLFYSIKIKNSIDSISPVLNMAEPSGHDFSIERGSEIYFKGHVLDNHSLEEGKIEITFIDTKGRTNFPIQEFFSEEKKLKADFDIVYKVPSHFAKGEYLFQVAVYDKYNNSTMEEFKIIFK